MNGEILKNREIVSFFGTASFTMADDIINSTADEMFNFRDSTAEPEYNKFVIVPEKPAASKKA